MFKGDADELFSLNFQHFFKRGHRIQDNISFGCIYICWFINRIRVFDEQRENKHELNCANICSQLTQVEFHLQTAQFQVSNFDSMLGNIVSTTANFCFKISKSRAFSNFSKSKSQNLLFVRTRKRVDRQKPLCGILLC